jgi:two-component system sensor histidine kinase GlrK
MRVIYPSSFLQFTLLGFVAAAIPILAGLMYSVGSLDRLERDSQHAVYLSAQVVNGSRDLIDAAIAMERAARQYAILGDAKLWSGYLQSRERFVSAGAVLEALAWNGRQWRGLRELLAREAGLNQAIGRAESKATEITAQTNEFSSIVEGAKAISEQSHELVDQEIAALLTRTEKERARVNWMLFGLAPLAVLMLAGVPLLIVKPIRQIDAAIRRLRDGNLKEPIKVDGPGDLEYLAQRLDWMRQGLLDAEAEKSRFLRHLSHELKTPLAAVRESTDLLWDGSLGRLTGTQTEVVSILRHNAQRLQKLIEDLLAYRSLLSDPHQAIRQPTPVRRVVERVIQDWRSATLAKSVYMNNDVDDIEWPADPDKLRVIVDNLVSNAVKFSPARASIGIRSTVNEQELVLEVCDQGPGLAEVDRARVFDAFFQGKQPAASSVQGTGLGLSIARELVLAHGGRIAIEDGPDKKGTCFQVFLPKGSNTTT